MAVLLIEIMDDLVSLPSSEDGLAFEGVEEN